jgi:hypothetical protein
MSHEKMIPAFVLSSLCALGGCAAGAETNDTSTQTAESHQAFHRDAAHEQTMAQRAIARFGVNVMLGRRPRVTMPHGRAERRWAQLILKHKVFRDEGVWLAVPGVGGGSWVQVDDGTLAWTLSNLEFRFRVVKATPDELGFGVCRIDFPRTGITDMFFRDGLHADFLCINYLMNGNEAESGGGRNNGVGLYLPEINTEIWSKREDRTRITIDNNEWELDTAE